MRASGHEQVATRKWPGPNKASNWNGSRREVETKLSHDMKN